MGYAFSYYGADAMPDEGRKSDAASTDQIRAVVKVIGSRLKPVYKVEDLSLIPDRLEDDLVRRVA